MKNRIFAVIQSLGHGQIFVTPWTEAHQAPLSSTISQSLFKFMPIHISSALLKLKVFMSVYYISYLLLL